MTGNSEADVAPDHGGSADTGPRPAVAITGAGSGIGAATVQALAGEASVVAIDVAARPQELAGVESLAWVRGDVADEKTWVQVEAECRRLDARGASALITCAAELVVAPFLDTPIEEWGRLLDVNVLGVLRGMRALMPAMIERGSGAIAAVCSVNSSFVEDQLSAYSTSKAALLHLVRSAALEHAADGLRINAVLPGAVDTPLLRRHLRSLHDPDGARRAIERRTPTGRIVSPGEVAALLRFLIGDGATALSGAAVTIDGGLTSTYDFAGGPERGTR